MPQPRALVVGASIAGPMTAYWLARAGWKVTVIERFPALRTGGQNIDIRTIGVTVMNKIPGLEPAVRRELAPIDGFALVHNDGTAYATMGSSGDANAQSLVSEYEIYRGDLCRLFVDLTKDDENVTYVYDEQVAAIKNNEPGSTGPVLIEFQNHTPPSEYEVVVACDGATSRTRALAFNTTVREHIKPVKYFQGFFSMNQDLLNGSRVAKAITATGGRMLGVGPDKRPGWNRITMVGVWPQDDTTKDVTLPFREANKKGTEALKEYAGNWFKGCGWETETILEALKTSDDFYASEGVQVLMPTHHTGRVVLVGDAGYAGGPTGTGTSLAIGGSYVLAGELCRSKGDVAAGLKAYEERMEPIIADLQKIPGGIPGIMAPQTWWGLMARNTVYALVSWALQFGKFFTWIPSLFTPSMGGDKYNLPDYEWEREVTRKVDL